MIGELKDIWIVFRKAYNEHFALKHKAYDAIKKYEATMDNIGRVGHILDKIYRNLDEVYLQLPIKERQDFVKPTLDLLRYDIRANKDGSFLGFGFIDIYLNLYHKLKSDYNYIKDLYKEKKYIAVIERVDHMLVHLDNLYLEWKIVEQK